jgi:D-sedoheptulose 7-phosphate isomerase
MLTQMLDDAGLQAQVEAAAAACVRCLRKGGKILLAGNGGSAADAQHLAAELVGRFALERAALPAIALNTNTSTLTAIGNDFGFDYIFARQVRAYGTSGDVFIGYSTSGASANILQAFEEARAMDMIRIGMTGNRGGPMREVCDHLVQVPSAETPIIQEGHAVLGHVLCGLVEVSMFGALE